MQPFHSIESLRHVIQHIKANCDYHQLEVKPTIKFRGTVKLHGTNAGVAITRDASRVEVSAQGRNRSLTVGDDNFGFAHFVAQRKLELIALSNELAPGLTDFTMYGEFCGSGIQKGIAIGNLPKMFVVFAVKNHVTEEWVDIFDIVPDNLEWLNNQNIYLVTQVPVFEVEIDFNDPTPAAELIDKLTLQVEERCPFAHLPVFTAYHHGEAFPIAIGEGIVWESRGYKDALRFKSKGLKHKKGGAKVRAEVDPEKQDAIATMVDELLPDWRLEQGFTHLRESNIPVVTQSTGEYLKWVCQDILKEEADTIAAGPFPWKELAGQVNRTARDHYLAKLDEYALMPSAKEG